MNANFDQARAVLPLRRLLQTYGYVVPPDKSSGIVCPICNKQASASVREKGGRQWFKCFNTACLSGTSAPKGAWDEVKFIAWKLNLSNADGGEKRYSSAQIQYLREAGVWKDSEPPRMVIGSKLHKAAPPTPSPSFPPQSPTSGDGTSPPPDSSPEQPPASDGAVAPVAPTLPPSAVPEAAGLSNIIPLHGGGATNVPSQPPEGRAPTPLPPKPTPLERFYEQLTLTDADREELHVKRGLSYETIDRHGFRSNHKPNKEILERLADEYEVGELLREGLWKRGDKRDRESRLRPTGQFYGWGVVAKKAKAPDPEDAEDYDDIDTDEFDWAQKESGRCNPILIPYRDADGKLISLRPHRGFIKGHKPRLYVARTMMGARAVITEGEFKAAAVADIMADWSVAGLPGITQCKNFHVWGDILNWIKRGQIKEVVIAFDNEEKGDPKLPGYKSALEKRFEAEVWARVLAARLEKEGVRVSIATLPKEWQENGKADWDSALARLRKVHSKDSGPIRKEFQAVLDAALRSWEFKQMKMFDSEVEGVISDRAANFSYDPGLPNGGQSEKRMAKQLRELARKLRTATNEDGNVLKISGRLMGLAEEYDKTWGWYFTFKIASGVKEKLESEKMRAYGADQLNAYNLLLKGTPHLIAPFRLTPYHVLVKPDGTRERLVRLVNTRGEDSGLVTLPSRDLTAPRDWRQCLANIGNYGWEGGERELQTLQRDINFKLARRVVDQLVFYGCDDPDSPWFYDDCALFGDVTIVPDADGIYWHNGKGYTYVRNKKGMAIGDENQSFRLNDLPKMHPGMGLHQRPVIVEEKLTSYEFYLKPGDDDPQALAELTGTLAMKMRESFSEYDGLLLMAAYVSFAAGPDLYALRGEFPGIWTVGQKGSGKTVSAKAGMAIHGYANLESTTSLKSSTTVNVIHTLTQLANIPNWCDEYKEGELKEEQVKNILHCGFGREIPGKHSPDGSTRTIRTNFSVTGESTCASAASTMDRYLTVVASDEHWSGTVEERMDRFHWLLDQRKFFFAIMRAVLRRRKEFVATVLRVLEEWERRPELSHAEPRGRFSHGVALGALRGLVQIIPFLPSSELDKFEAAMVTRTMKASREVKQEVNVNRFLEDMLSAVKVDAFGEGPAALKKIFKAMEMSGGPAKLTEEQIRQGAERSKFAWKHYRLFVTPRVMVGIMLRYYAARGMKLPLDQRDLRAQLAVRSFWVPPPGDLTMHKQRFAGQTNENCWCFEVDEMSDWGFVSVTDDEFERSKYKDGEIEKGNYLGLDEEWVDPRKGDLFYLIDLLLKKEGDKSS